jgi:peroxiredoxin
MGITVTVGQGAPAFELAEMNGGRYSLQETLSKGPLLAAFFKVSCPTCQFTFPFIERLYQQFHAQGFRIYGISQDTARDSQRFARQFGITFPILIDEEPYEISKEYGLVYVPTLFLIKPDGRVEASSDGFSKSDLLEIQRWLAKHFNTPPAELFRTAERVPEYKPG